MQYFGIRICWMKKIFCLRTGQDNEHVHCVQVHLLQKRCVKRMCIEMCIEMWIVWSERSWLYEKCEMEKYIAAAGCGNYIYNIKCYGKSSIRTQRRTLVIFTLFRIVIYTIGNLCIAMAANDQEIWIVSCICQSCNGNSVVNDLGCSVLPWQDNDKEYSGSSYCTGGYCTGQYR